ncbi:MAG: helix-turn-helix transcriptional regulator [Clostridia bacterium]|nr:helix-turn-helix transcriptional regulator [Clostridia bacterium]
MALSADILRGYTDTIILRQLSQGDSYGYQINKNVSALSGGKFEMKEATLYTAFRRLEAAGLIRSYWGDEMSGARRRYYAISAQGLARLDADLQVWKETKAQIDLLLEV